MKNVPIIGKFMIIMSFFGLFAIAVAIYSDVQLTNTDAAYHELLEGNSAAALNLARANRSLQGARAALGDLLMSRTEELNARASAELEKYKSDFLGFVDTATVAMPSNAEIPALKAAGLAVLEQACQSTHQAAGRAVSEADVAASQQLFLTQCQPAFGPVSEELMEWMPPPDGIAMCQSDVRQNVTRGESIHEGS